MGVAPDQVLELFRQPAYAAAHQAYRVLGEEAIRDLIATYRKVWRPVRIIDKPFYEPGARNRSALAPEGDARDA